MLSPMARQSTLGLTFGLLGWLMISPVLTAQTALQNQTPSNPALRAAATAFRVDTDIYTKVNNNNNNVPDKQMLTLFNEGVYYDFPMDDEKQTITMTDPARGRIVVLSPSRLIKTVFKTEDMSARIDALKKDLSANKDLAKMFSASQKIEFDQTNNVLKVGDESFAYEATLQTARDASMAQQYADFADWSARLNTLLPPNFPPFLRMELNRQIAARGALPDTITRITRHNGNASTIRSKLIVVASLSSDDKAKINLVGELLGRCKEVSQTEFFTNPAEIARAGVSPRSGTK